MTKSSIQRGRFALRPNFARNQWLKAIGVSLVTLATGLGMLVYSYFLLTEIVRVTSIWKRGVDTTAEVTYEGSVKTHKALFKDYELQVTYLPEGADQAVQFEAEFMRFFAGPDEGDPIGVRYLEHDPTQAITTWQHEGIVHDWIWFGLAVVMGAGMTVFTFVFVRNTAQIVDTVHSLSREGQLIFARVESLKRESQNGVGVVHLVYRTARGESTKQAFKLGLEPYLDEAGEQVLVLSSLDERRSHALAQDGFPLLERPEPPALPK